MRTINSAREEASCGAIKKTSASAGECYSLCASLFVSQRIISHRKKREQKAKMNQKLGKPNDDEFDLFINSAEIRYTYVDLFVNF